MWHIDLRWLLCVLSFGTSPCCCVPLTGCQVATMLKWSMMWTNKDWPCVSRWYDMVEWCPATWHRLGEVDHWLAATWY
jgi:hypothetical protein